MEKHHCSKWKELKIKDGSGIIFLPKDIKTLWQKLKLLGVEYIEDNKTNPDEMAELQEKNIVLLAHQYDCNKHYTLRLYKYRTVVQQYFRISEENC